VSVPEVHYTRSGDVAIAYQVVGDGPMDIVFVRGTLADLLAAWDQPLFVDHVEGLASFARVILFDKRGSGLSDPVNELPTLEARMDDVRAVLDALASERATMWSAHEGARLAVLFAATHPERTSALALYDPSARGLRAPDYPWAPTEEEWAVELREIAEHWGVTANTSPIEDVATYRRRRMTSASSIGTCGTCAGARALRKPSLSIA
jgi:pimeloyl-ACP methyl ester carboxylesterase